MTDEELRRIYTEASAKNFPDSGISDGLRAVFLAGAREERERAILEHDNSACAAEIADLKKRIEVAHAEGFADGARAQREMEPTDEMVRAARQIIRYAETPGRTLQGLRDHLRLSGVEYESWFPLWAMEYGTLTKGAIALLIYTAMQRAAPPAGDPTVCEEG